jgi:hypothetical protein
MKKCFVKLPLTYLTPFYELLPNIELLFQNICFQVVCSQNKRPFNSSSNSHNKLPLKGVTNGVFTLGTPHSDGITQHKKIQEFYSFS